MDQNTHSANPLATHFRQPAIFVKLPSNGRYWPESAILMPATGELGIMPMTTRDEITLRTPDALLNGEGVVSIIHSCCPDIKDAWNAPSVDIDPLLIAIRIASYGGIMDVDTKCPKCEEENMFGVDLRNVLDGITFPDFNDLVLVDELKIKLKPQTYKQINDSNMIMFEEQQILRTINDDTIAPEVKKMRFDENLKKLINLNIIALTNSTEYVELADGTRVANIEHIAEFYQKCASATVKAIRAKLDELSKNAAIKPVKVVCEHCQHQYDLALTFDYASFFGIGF